MTSMATSHTRWAVVMSRNAGFIDQCVELDFQYPSEGIHRRWDGGFRITSCASTPDQVRCSHFRSLFVWDVCVLLRACKVYGIPFVMLVGTVGRGEMSYASWIQFVM